MTQRIVATAIEAFAGAFIYIPMLAILGKFFFLWRENNGCAVCFCVLYFCNIRYNRTSECVLYATR